MKPNDFMISSEAIIMRIQRMFPDEKADEVCMDVMKYSPCTLLDFFEFLISVKSVPDFQISLTALSELVIELSRRGIKASDAGEKLRNILEEMK